MLHYGTLDVPGPTNFSASFNETVFPAYAALRTIYAQMAAEAQVQLVVSPALAHEMDIELLTSFLAALQKNEDVGN